jgi:hypothetical protein
MTPAPPPLPLEEQLIRLRRERRDLAASLVKRSCAQFERSARREHYQQTLTALRRLLDAELALADLPTDRVAVLERHCDAIERLWQLEKTFFEMGRVPFADFEPVCSYPLRDARVRLYEARQRQTAH